MMQVVANRVELSGALTLDTASDFLRTGSQALAQMSKSQPAVFDFAKLEQVDSAALTVVFAWLQKAQASGLALQIQNPPRQLLSLAEVYDVSSMLPLA